MGKAHLQLLSDAMGAIDKVHEDTSVSKEDTKASLEEILDHIETLLEALDVE